MVSLHSNLLEAVQRQSVRFIFNNYSPYASVSEMLNKLDFKTLTERRNESKLILFYKVLNNLVDIDTSNILYPRPTVHDTRGHHLRFLPFTTRVDSYHNSFFPSAIRNWNNLPEYV